MKKLFCSQYKNIECCDSCHLDDQFFKTMFKGFEINHCCSSKYDIEQDILKHSDEPLEDSCRD